MLEICVTWNRGSRGPLEQNDLCISVLQCCLLYVYYMHQLNLHQQVWNHVKTQQQGPLWFADLGQFLASNKAVPVGRVCSSLLGELQSFSVGCRIEELSGIDWANAGPWFPDIQIECHVSYCCLLPANWRLRLPGVRVTALYHSWAPSWLTRPFCFKTPSLSTPSLSSSSILGFLPSLWQLQYPLF